MKIKGSSGQLSGLLYLKYNFSRGMIVKVHIKVDMIFHEDQDVGTHTDEFGNKSLLVNMCLDTGADLACSQHEFLGSAQLNRLSDKNLTIVTVLGNQKKTFKRYKVEFCKANGRLGILKLKNLIIRMMKVGIM